MRDMILGLPGRLFFLFDWEKISHRFFYCLFQLFLYKILIIFHLKLKTNRFYFIFFIKENRHVNQCLIANEDVNIEQ